MSTQPSARKGVCKRCAFTVGDVHEDSAAALLLLAVAVGLLAARLRAGDLAAVGKVGVGVARAPFERAAGEGGEHALPLRLGLGLGIGLGLRLGLRRRQGLGAPVRVGACGHEQLTLRLQRHPALQRQRAQRPAQPQERPLCTADGDSGRQQLALGQRRQ